jgi:hypothetical protein
MPKDVLFTSMLEVFLAPVRANMKVKWNVALLQVYESHFISTA